MLNFFNLFMYIQCFGIIGTAFAEPIVSFLIGQLDHKDARKRVGTLQIFKHLVSFLFCFLYDFFELF